MTAATNIPAYATARSVFIFTATCEIITFPNCFLNWCNKTKQSTQAGLRRCQSTRMWPRRWRRLRAESFWFCGLTWRCMGSGVSLGWRFRLHVYRNVQCITVLFFKTSRKQLWPVCWCCGSEPARSLYTLTADSCMTVSHFDIFQQCIWPASIWCLMTVAALGTGPLISVGRSAGCYC